jgi:hypothetical protein
VSHVRSSGQYELFAQPQTPELLLHVAFAPQVADPDEESQ